jgi:hypothetical protein
LFTSGHPGHANCQGQQSPKAQPDKLTNPGPPTKDTRPGQAQKSQWEHTQAILGQEAKGKTKGEALEAHALALTLLMQLC